MHPSGGTEALQCLVTRKLQQDPQCGKSVVPRLPRADLEGEGVSRGWGEEMPDLSSFLQKQLGQYSEASPNGELPLSVQQNS